MASHLNYIGDLQKGCLTVLMIPGGMATSPAVYEGIGETLACQSAVIDWSRSPEMCIRDRPNINTIADGTAVKRPGELLFPYIQQNIDDIITIEDSELIVAFLDMVENHKMIVENSGLLTVAALKHMNCLLYTSRCV